MQRLMGLVVIATVIVMLALAGNTLFRNVPLDSTWSLFLGGIIVTIFGAPEVATRLREKNMPAPPPPPATAESKDGGS